MRGPRRGFTLWELVIVLTLLGVVASLALPAFTDLEKALGTQPADPVLNLLHGARRLAIARRGEVAVLLDPVSRHYRVDTLGLDGGVGTVIDATLSVAPGVVLTADSARVHFRFLATGAAIADTLRVQADGKQLTVTADPWEGMTRVDAR